MFVGYFGQNQNKLVFQDLTRRLPFIVISKHLDNELQIEALLYGAAGLLDVNSADPYVQELFGEYSFLKSKYGLTEVNLQWKFGGIRPESFPTRRLALLARIIPHIQSIYNNILSVKEYSWPILGSISHKYWDYHYTFNDNSDNSKK